MELLALAAFGTAVLSATMGMAGGLLLMGLFVAALPVPEAMVLHGFTQLVANGSRATLLRAHVAWGALAWYAVGSLVAWGIFRAVAWTPDAALVMVGIGSLPFVARLLRLRADVTRPGHAVAAGVSVGAVQLLFGVAGPLLDLFFLDTPLDKRGVVATKAVTQTVAHTLKIAAFVPLVERVPLDAVLACTGAAALGTMVGSRILERIPEATFRRATGALVLAIGGFYLARGVAMMG